jgi:IclR family KDG regulon transcriptional repressor
VRSASALPPWQLPKSTLHRLIKTLINEGFVRRTVHGQYCGTVKLWRIGANAVDYDTIRQQALPILQQLVEETSETAHYAVYESGTGVYLEKVDGTHPIRSYTAVGGRSPAYASATGKAILAWRDEREIAEIGRIAQRLTPATRVGAKELCRHAAEIRAAGFSVNRGEWREDVWGIAAPIFGPTGEVIASVGISCKISLICRLIGDRRRTKSCCQNLAPTTFEIGCRPFIPEKYRARAIAVS